VAGERRGERVSILDARHMAHHNIYVQVRQEPPVWSQATSKAED